jgi:hypothetical protein
LADLVGGGAMHMPDPLLSSIRRDVSDLFFYSLHQRILASDCELRFLSPADAVAEPDLTLTLTTFAEPRQGMPWYSAEAAEIDRTETGELVMRFADGTVFLIGERGQSIALLAAPPEYTHDDLAAYALGPALMLALHLQGAVLLHASAVVISGKAVVFAGQSGSGKSTTVAMLHRHGYTILSDDVTEIADGKALPSVPSVRLWPDVLEALYGSAAAFPDRAPSWDKKMIRTPDASGAHEIAAVLFLEARTGVACLQRLDARAGWLRMMAAAPAARLPGERMERKVFETTSALADRVPMYTFTPPPLAEAATLGPFLERELAEHLR